MNSDNKNKDTQSSEDLIDFSTRQPVFFDEFSSFNADFTGIKTKKNDIELEHYIDPDKFAYLKMQKSRGKNYSATIYKLGIVICLTLLVTNLLTHLTAYSLNSLEITVEQGSDIEYFLNWFLSDLFMYGVPFLLLYFIFRYETYPKDFERHHEYKGIIIIPTIFAVYFAMIGGSFFTEFISSVIHENFGVGKTVNVYENLMPESAFQTAVFYFMTIFAAPVAEEVIFRRMMLKPLRRFGDYSAVFITALFFALSHGNLSQFLYAFFGGIVLGFSAVWSGSVIAPIILHMIINAFEVFRVEIYKLAETETFPLSERMIDIAVYIVIIAGALSLIGLIAAGMFRLKNTCPDISNREKLSIVLINPLFILALAFMTLQLFL